VLAATLLFDTGTSVVVLGAWFFGLALAMGWVMAPATEAVVSAVPAARSGVASAMNTVARMVSAALGVAVVGSIISSLYESDMASSTARLPAPAGEAAQESVGAAVTIAARLPGDAGDALAGAASSAFVDAMGIGLLVAAGLSALIAPVVARGLSARRSAAARRQPAAPMSPVR
jgi:hypothetical protein